MCVDRGFRETAIVIAEGGRGAGAAAALSFERTPTRGLQEAGGERAASSSRTGWSSGSAPGRTAIFATRKLGELLSSGPCGTSSAIPTSRATEDEARRLGIPLIDDSIPREIDLTIDGADEVDPALNLIKGGGGALFREKIVAQASRRVVIVVDESKLSPALGTRHALPVEVVALRLAVAGALPGGARR